MLTPSTGAPPQEKREITEVSIPFTKMAEETCFYLISVKEGSESWTVQKRYSQFEEFHSKLSGMALAAQIPSGVELPGKKIKMFVSHDDANFIEERRCLLEAYLKRLVNVKPLAQSDVLFEFLSSHKLDIVVAESKTKKELPEDVEVTGICIPATRTMSDHVLYQIDVLNSRKRSTYSEWTVLKRFGQFFDMDFALRESFASNFAVMESLPPPPSRRAKLLFDHMDDAFVEQRRVLLENYLNRLLHIPAVARSESFLNFLGVTL